MYSDRAIVPLLGRAALARPAEDLPRLGLHDGFLHHAARSPAQVALTIGTRSWTYAEAADTALRWSARLFDAAGQRPKRVGILGSRSETAYLGVLASLFAGAAFVPLNPKFPADRTRSMIVQAGLDALLVDGPSLPRLAEVLDGLGTPVLVPDTDAQAVRNVVRSPVFGREELARTAPLSRLPTVGGNDLAYLLFTSGSTGKPKGVPITHGNTRAFLDTNHARYDFGPEDRFSQTFDQTFDLSVFDLFMAWESGARVCSMRAIELLAPFRYLEDQQITVWFSVPSAAGVLMKRGALRPDTMPTLRWSLFCGEGLPQATAEAWQAAAPRSTLENLYGPTELTIACAAYRWHPETSTSHCVNSLVPIGAVYPGLPYLLVDEELRDVPSGQPGELCVSGPQTTDGYWRAPELDAGRFFERTHTGGQAVRYYRTGDLVGHGASGSLVYLGRTDQQVKIGGYRIELGEIEAVLRQAGTVDAVALPWPDALQPHTIVAAVSGPAGVATLMDAARNRLPSYMVPKIIVHLDPLPLNVNGKVDRRAVAAALGPQLLDGDVT